MTLALAGIALLLQGCQQPRPQAASTTRRYATDEEGGAKVCTTPPLATLAPGKEIAATVSVGNDGGWCGILVDNAGHPFAAGLLTTRPAHGRVYIHSVGDATRIDYYPNPKYVGPDSFMVHLLPGEGTVRATVSVTKAG